MKKIKTNFIWFYSVLLFSVTLLLILISTMSQSRLSPSDALNKEVDQQAFNQTIQKSVTDLIRENENLRAEIKTANEKIKQLESESEVIANENNLKALAAESTECVVKAGILYNTEKYQESRASLQEADYNALNATGQELYDWLKHKLAGRGYEISKEEM